MGFRSAHRDHFDERSDLNLSAVLSDRSRQWDFRLALLGFDRGIGGDQCAGMGAIGAAGLTNYSIVPIKSPTL